MTKRYLVVSAIRIQSWLVRAPRLRLIRGGSLALADRTRHGAIDGILDAAGFESRTSSEGGDIDGVVVIDVDENDDAEKVAAFVADHIHEGLPGIQISAWSAEAESYVHAHESWSDDVLGGSGSGSIERFIFLPSRIDLPFTRKCVGCGVEPAGVGAYDDDYKGWLGADCTERRRSADAKVEEDRRLAQGSRMREQAKDFDELAAVGAQAGREPLGRGQFDNHLATVAADGNNVGNLMRSLIGHYKNSQGAVRRVLHDLLEHFPELLDTCTREAVAEAKDAATDGTDTTVPVATHFIGGDDVLLSVTAARVWTLVDVLMRAFDKKVEALASGDLRTKTAPPDGGWSLAEVDAAVRGLDGEDRASAEKAVEQLRSDIRALSLGVGVTIADSAHPFSDAQQLAFAALKQAKALTRGEKSAVCWIDLAAESQIPAERVVGAACVRTWMQQPPPLMLLPASARTELEGVRRGDHKDNDEAVKAIHAWARRTRQPEQLKSDIEGDDPAKVVAGVRDQLSLARWWSPCTDDVNKAREAK